ncbi:hypothetical protein [Spirosoma rhododendri]|uniref:DUF6089 domain-containing protein n=1 Tax=Spirosoma rhododendri TaxID=2728024 RepID=A0A7L5DST8_9BACT|nr:hypothetical protein [Spirosoma rhododendri]QJD80672.1 hypothetical protein HH216_21310 [Spirosoma rhododendri]
MIRHLLVISCWLLSLTGSHGQRTGQDSSAATGNERPQKARFIAELDQRFFYFKDRRQPLFSNSTSVWGGRAGFLLPSNIKVGLGYYFTNHDVDEPWDGHQTIRRRLNYATAYVEPYLFRRTYWELSVPIEAGVGSVRYRFEDADATLSRTVQTTVIPLSVGVSVSLKFPVVFNIRPIRWFGVNLITGYRYTLYDEAPTQRVTLNGLYYSVSPAIFLDRIYADYEVWRKKHRARKAK